MRTAVEVVASPGRLDSVSARGALAVRQTGPSTVHLVGTAAGPMGGDVTRVVLRVGAGAALSVRSAAASIVLPHRLGGLAAAVELDVEVGADGSLDLDLEPTVVAAGAHLEAAARCTLAAGARLRWRERVQLGRHGEPAGRWASAVRVVADGTVVLAHRVDLGPGAAAWAPPVAPRAYASELVVGEGAEPHAATGSDAVLLPLRGGSLVSAWGGSLRALDLRLPVPAR